MCGIVGYIGHKQALPILLSGLRDLEYRGYDSAGVAVLDNGKIFRIRAVGKVDKLAEKIGNKEMFGNVGIAHTRWATHGGVTEDNAHPHFALAGKLALAHNGIIENYRELKKELEQDGIKFSSETDTEVLGHLIGKYYTNDLALAVKQALLKVRGTYGIGVLHQDHPDLLVAARMGSPLVIGIGAGEYYLASDVTPMLSFTKEVKYLDDGEIAIIRTNSLKVINLKEEEIKKDSVAIEWNKEEAQKTGYEHFMLKEIFDQPVVFEDAIRGRLNMENGSAVLGGLNMNEKEILNIKRILIVAEGTARHAGMAAKNVFERLSRIPCEVDFSSEFRYRDPIVEPETLVFVISQSGETADTLIAAREARLRGGKVRGIVNVIGSTIAREAGAGSYIHAGPELSVASTKAYTNMIAVLFLYGLQFARVRGIEKKAGQDFLFELLKIPEKMNAVLKINNEIKKIAEKYSSAKDMLFIGRGVNFSVSLEGALKMEEITYIHAEGLAAGSLKHGPLALVSKDVPVVAILTKNQLYEKMKSSVMEVKARGAKVLVIATEGDEEVKEIADDVIYVPKTMELLEPLLNTIPLQLFAYHMAVVLGRDVDRPRNLAKSVTVE